MPTDIAIIRAYNRPEFLFHSLLCVNVALQPDGLWVVGWIDVHEKINQDISLIMDGKVDYGTVYSSENSTGDSRSFLAALKWCLSQGAERIYNIEEDVLISPDFFHWHQSAHALGHYPLTVASNYHNDPRVSSDAEPSAVFASPNSNPIGCCFSRWFAEMLVVHNTPDYWQSFPTMSGYLGVNFPEFPSNVNLQWDGMMWRLMRRYNLQCLYPLKPRAYHAGFYGSNREVKDPFPGLPLKDKIHKVGEIIYNNEKLQEVSGHVPDCQAFDLKESQWEKLVLV